MKNYKLFSLATLLLTCLTGHSALVFQDSFAEAAGTLPPAGWTGTDGVADAVSSGSLSYSGLAASPGNKWSVVGTANYTNTYTGTPLASGSTLYYSFLFRMDNLSGLGTGHTSNLILLASSTTLSTGAASFGVMIDADNPAAYNIVFDGDFRGPANTTSVKDPNNTEFLEGQTLLLVASYTRATSGTTTANFWVNPDAATLGEASAPSPYITDIATATRAINTLIINSGTSASSKPSFSLDEFRLGDTWADVTPVPEPATVSLLLGLGALGLAIWRRR